MSATASQLSITTLVTVLQNLVTALNNETQTYLNVQGALNFAAVATTTLVSAKAGRIAVISVTSAGSSVGMIYDGATVTALTKPIYVIPNTVGVYAVNLPVSFGLLVVPGTGQVVSGSYS